MEAAAGGGAEVADFPKRDVLEVGAVAAGGAEVVGIPKRDVLEVGAAASGAEVVGSPKRGVLEVGAVAAGVEVVGSPKRGVLEAGAAAGGGGAEVARVPEREVPKAGSDGAAEDPVAEGSEKLDAKSDVCEVSAG